MHRHDAKRGQVEIERGEHRFLHLAGIGRVADQDDLLGEVDGDHGVAAHAVARRIGLEARQVDDGEFGGEVFEFENVGPDQQLPDEQRMPGELGIDPRFYPVFRIGAAVEILREQRLAARMRDEIVVQQLEIGLAELAVAVPPHGVLGQRVDHGVLVLRAPAGMHAGLGAKGAAVHQRALAVADGVLDEQGVGQIPMHAGEVFEAEFIGAVRAVPHSRFLHPSLRLLARAACRKHVGNPGPWTAAARCRMRPPAGRRPYIGHPSMCQERSPS